MTGFDLDGAGPVSQTFTVNVIAAPGRLRNISTRVSFPVGNEEQIAGFIMRGGTSKRLVVRAIGPSLSVPNPISDPTLELRDINQTLLASSDDWIDSPDKLLLAGLNLAPTSDNESASHRDRAFQRVQRQLHGDHAQSQQYARCWPGGSLRSRYRRGRDPLERLDPR